MGDCLRSITHGFTNRNEVNRNGLGTLMKELKVGVLGITTGATKYDW